MLCTPPFPVSTIMAIKSYYKFHDCLQLELIILAMGDQHMWVSYIRHNKQKSHADRIKNYGLMQFTATYLSMSTEARFRIEYDWKKNYKQMWGLDKCTSTITVTIIMARTEVARVQQRLSSNYVMVSKRNIWSFFATNLIKSKEKNGIFSSWSFTFPQPPLNGKRKHSY